MSRRVVTIHQPECFPWLGFVDKAAQSDVLVLLDDTQFSKNYFQNRNKIRTAQGWSWITIPVKTTGRSDQQILEVEIDDSSNWRRKHLASWTQAYGSAKFGKQHLLFLNELYERPFTKLAQFNVSVIRWLLNEFGVKAQIVLSSELGCPGTATDKLLALCQKLNADEYLSGISGKEYLEEAKFKDACIAVRYQEFHHPVYKQRFEPFIPALSSLDLLMNHGPDAAKILRDPALPRMTELFL